MKISFETSPTGTWVRSHRQKRQLVLARTTSIMRYAQSRNHPVLRAYNQSIARHAGRVPRPVCSLHFALLTTSHRHFRAEHLSHCLFDKKPGYCVHETVQLEKLERVLARSSSFRLECECDEIRNGGNAQLNAYFSIASNTELLQLIFKSHWTYWSHEWDDLSK